MLVLPWAHHPGTSKSYGTAYCICCSCVGKDIQHGMTRHINLLCMLPLYIFVVGVVVTTTQHAHLMVQSPMEEVMTVLADQCRRTIYDDPFIRNYIEDLLKNIRTQVVLNIVQPYTRIRIPFISKHLNIPEHDVEQLLVSLILDNRIRGHIDQVPFATSL